MASLLRSAGPAARQALAVSASPLAASSSSSSVLRTAALHTSRALGKDPQLGDYPDVAYSSRQLRKSSPKWFDPQEKANYAETLHEQEDVLSVWAPDLHQNVKPTSALFQLLLAAGAASLFASIIYATRPSLPAMPRSYPRDGLAEELGGPQVAAYTGAEAGEVGEEVAEE
ncbi:hypothetical protein K437DRAFT_259298 [Tilletiaria anomala UBC 951]|uniref:Uncharacterized protein n=1 Tax=Tilletiaria anomala (strain ATCC 24038 / CBS 436.72 / UBC 951) TaxID=1037660 RepID=A0A066VBH2_TILAU|nr:uncharacterized protein K437DRAFT_259298 [Tilletiaria anomala UBC 951]KDN38801.1 hypothetical protein K437DRAFT_259298 [Tilletiaria anomala UBC 951]